MLDLRGKRKPETISRLTKPLEPDTIATIHPMNPHTQAIIDSLDFQASKLELEHAAKKDIIVSSPASKLTKRRASEAARQAAKLRRRIRSLIVKQYA